MSTPEIRPTSRRGRRKVWAGIASLAAAVGLFLTIGAGTASAFVTCVYDGTTGTLTVTGTTAADDVTFTRGGGSPGTILVNGATCFDGVTASAAQVNNVDQVYVNLSGGWVTIDNSNGRVTEPGFTTEAPVNGLNEIEWAIQGISADANHDAFRYIDTNAAGAVNVGECGDGTGVQYDGRPFGAFPLAPFVPCGDPDNVLLNLNAFPADDDADVVINLAGVLVVDQPFITLDMGGGDDFVTGKGGNGTGRAVGDPTPFIDSPEDPFTPGLDAHDPEINLDIDGGTGNNEIEGGLDDDTITGNPGDVLNGNANNAVDTGCVQNDTEGVYESGSSGGDTLDVTGVAGPLTIVINEDGSITITPAPVITAVDFENVLGSAGNDTITGNSLDNVLSGGAGNDTISGGAGDDVLIGGDGDDVLAGDAGNDCVLGGAGNDILNENTGTDPGNPGNGNGADALDGGPGLDDVVDYGQRTTRVVIYLGIISWNNDGGDENADSASEECDDVFFSTENAIGGSGNDIISADFLNNQSDNEFTGGDGNDQLDGGAGNDIFHEGTAANGSDAMQGDSGADLADYSGRSNGVTVSVNDGAGNDGEPGEGDSVGALMFSSGNVVSPCAEDHSVFSGGNEPFAGDEADDTNPGIENVAGGSGNDVLVGDGGANILTGNAGNDTLIGNGGSDVLSGGDGDDQLAGGPGNDQLDGGAGTDWVDYQSAGAGGVGVQVNLTTGTATGEGVDALTGLENVGGSSFADTIRGDAGNNVLNGRGGNDAIQGAGGDDVINGGAGHDELAGNGGNDTVRGQSGRDTVRGGGGNDVVRGDGGNDTVFGGAANDNLNGGAGKDFLNGGPGTDRCRPGAPGFARGDVAVNCES